jgi:hypothetical protein
VTLSADYWEGLAREIGDGPACKVRDAIETGEPLYVSFQLGSGAAIQVWRYRVSVNKEHEGLELQPVEQLHSREAKA